MNATSRFKFLGTAGSRFVVARQARASGGIFIESGGKRLLMDPGPGALVRFLASEPKIDLASLDALVLTHNHLDHSNDINIIIDSMTWGGMRKQGVLYAPAECLEGRGAVVLRYLRSFLKDIVVLEAGKEYALGDLRFRTSIAHRHSAETYGLKFDMDGRRVAFLVDTQLFPELAGDYKGTDLLIVYVVRDTPFEDRTIMHLCIEDVRELIDRIKPGAAILTHFGTRMIHAGPGKIAAKLSKETGIPVRAARDGMTVDVASFPMKKASRLSMSTK